MQLAPQTVEKLQDAAGFGFHYRLHDQLATAVEDRDHDRFLVHVHADILNVATHFSCLLGGKITPRQRSLSLKVQCLSTANFAYTFLSSLGSRCTTPVTSSSQAQRSEGRATSGFNRLKQGILS